MRVFFGGVRGTSPVADSAFLAIGGDTTSLLIEGAAGERVLVDGGTGLRSVAPRCADGAPLLLLMTHYHLDHVMGLPTFAPFYRNGQTIEIAAPLRHGTTALDALGRLLGQPFWPVTLPEFSADLRGCVLPDDPWSAPLRRGGLEIRWCPVHHRQGCHAYRFDEPASGTSFVFATDLEWRAATPAERAALLRLCREPRPCDLLIMDGQFCADNVAQFRHWGHSTWEDAVAVAREGGARRLLVTHHAPASDDAYLATVDAALVASLPKARLACQGMEITVGDEG